MKHNELRDLEAELLNTVCKDVQIEPVLQDITGEVLNPEANKSADSTLDIHARGFWEKCSSAFFKVRVCHPVQIRTSTIAQSKYTRCTNKKRKVSTQPESWKSKRQLLIL